MGGNGVEKAVVQKPQPNGNQGTAKVQATAAGSGKKRRKKTDKKDVVPSAESSESVPNGLTPATASISNAPVNAPNGNTIEAPPKPAKERKDKSGSDRPGKSSGHESSAAVASPAEAQVSKYTEAISKKHRKYSKRLQRIIAIEEQLKVNPATKLEKEQKELLLRKVETEELAGEYEALKTQFTTWDEQQSAESTRSEKKAKKSELNSQYNLMREMATLMLAVATVDKYDPADAKDQAAKHCLFQLVAKLAGGGRKASSRPGATVLSKMVSEFVNSDAKAHLSHYLDSAPLSKALDRVADIVTVSDSDSQLTAATLKTSTSASDDVTKESPEATTSDHVSLEQDNQHQRRGQHGEAQQKKQKNRNKVKAHKQQKQASVEKSLTNIDSPQQDVSPATEQSDLSVEFLGPSMISATAQATHVASTVEETNKAAAAAVLSDPAVASAVLANPSVALLASNVTKSVPNGNSSAPEKAEEFQQVRPTANNGRGRGARGGRGGKATRGRSRGRGEGRASAGDGRGRGHGRGRGRTNDGGVSAKE